MPNTHKGHKVYDRTPMCSTRSDIQVARRTGSWQKPQKTANAVVVPGWGTGPKQRSGPAAQEAKVQRKVESVQDDGLPAESRGATT